MNLEEFNNLTNTKQEVDWVKVTSYLIIVIISFFLFKSCESVKELELKNKASNETVKRLNLDSQRYVDIANAYKDSVCVLQSRKTKVKDSLIYITEKVDAELKVVPTLDTKGIANYFYNRYKQPITITKYGVSLNDNVGHSTITDLMKGDGYKAKLGFNEQLLALEEKSGKAKDVIIANDEKVIVLKDSIILVKNENIKDVEKSFKKEKHKKNFWKVTTGIAVGIITYLAVKP